MFVTAFDWSKQMNDVPDKVPRMLTINETAKEAHLPRHFVWKLVKEKRIHYVMAGWKYLINFNLFIDFLNTGEEPAEAEPEVINNGRIRRLS